MGLGIVWKLLLRLMRFIQVNEKKLVTDFSHKLTEPIIRGNLNTSLDFGHLKAPAEVTGTVHTVFGILL